MSIGQQQVSPFIAFSSDDLDSAHAEWGCNCGPAALAACLGATPSFVRSHLGDFEARRYMNAAMMSAAVTSGGFRKWDASGSPEHGLIRVQWGGPWIVGGKPARWASMATHWIASKLMPSGLWVFDVNGGWQLLSEWERETAPKIINSLKRADGTWYPSHQWEVRRAQ